MRFAAFCLLTLASLPVAHAARPHAPAKAAPAAQNQPPHAWLFGTWTGGLFPVLTGMTAQDCRAQPTVVFGKDAISHASLLATGMSERNIATVRATPSGAEFTLIPQATAAPGGFGCDSADVLHVARSDHDTISFPGCSAFPYPLERCSG